MKYILFAGDAYYPAGGAEDIVGIYGTKETAMAAFLACKSDWCHIYEIESGRITETRTN